MEPPSVEARVRIQRNRLTHGVIVATGLVGGIGLLLAPLVSEPPTIPLIIHTLLVTFGVVAAILQRRNPPWWNGGAVISIFGFVVATGALWALGSPTSVALVAYITVQILAAVVWGSGPAMVLVGAMLLTSAAALAFPDLLYADPPAASKIAFWIGFALLSLLNGTIFLLSGRTIEELLGNLRISEDRLAALISSVPDGLVLLRADGTIASVNRAGQRLIGDSNDVVGRRVDQLPGLTQDSMKRAQKLVDHSVSGVANDELLTFIRDGRELALQARIGAVPMGRAGAAVVVALRDVTAQMANQREQEELRHQVVRQQKLESVGRLAGGIAHDFNNLLTIIRANAEFLEQDDGAALSENQGEALTDLKQAAERCASFTQRLLTLSRSHEFGRTEIVPDGLAKDVVQVFSRTLLPNVVLEIDMNASEVCIEANTAELEAALLNLLINAQDALGESGTIRVTTDITEADPNEALYLPVPVGGEYWILSVADDGPGMDDATMERATEPFFTTKGPGHGTGLGLATVYQLMEQLGGGMHFVSALGHGTTVSLFIPKSGSVARVESLDEARRQRFETRRRLLLVEDDPAVRSTTSRALELAGYVVSAVDNGHSALQWLEQNTPPDLLLSDILLPGMSGTELAEKVAVQYPEITILHISGFTGSEAERPRHPLLTKPFAPTELIDFIRQHAHTVQKTDAQA